MAAAKIPPLKPISLDSRPLTTHPLAWSCDADLAVAADDSIHVFLPEYPTISTSENEKGEIRQQYFSSVTRFQSTKPDPQINGSLFAGAGLPTPGDSQLDEGFPGVGPGKVAGSGSSLNQVISLEWSPSGVGHNLRPILTAMLTTGTLFAYGEKVNNNSQPRLSARTRNTGSWKVLWGLGGTFPLPDSSEEGFVVPKDRIKSFAWAKEIGPGTALLAYATDTDDVVIMSVQYYSPTGAHQSVTEGDFVWEVKEVGRFAGSGPHPKQHIMDPDYAPSGSAFSLKWSPFHQASNSSPLTGLLAYVARGYIGFRRIVVRPWKRGSKPHVEIGEADHRGICMPVGPDAFLEWENTIWDVGEDQICRGVIASPFRANPFQVAMHGKGSAPQLHSSSNCGSTYPDRENSSNEAHNPITGLIIHQPRLAQMSESPFYSLVRAFATATNNTWFQSNVPAASDIIEPRPIPQWAEHISRTVKVLVPEAMALQGLDSSDKEESNDEFDLPDDAGKQVHPHKMRIWGLVASPGGGATAVLVSKHSTVRPERNCKTQVRFGWTPPKDIHGGEIPPIVPNQTTESRVWERMYGGGPTVNGVALVEGDVKSPTLNEDGKLRKQFDGMLANQRCVYCQATLQSAGRQTRCQNNHVFATCSASGLAILAPGISRACAVCGLRCLLVTELRKLAEEYLGPDVVVEALGDVCAGCGGKFVV